MKHIGQLYVLAFMALFTLRYVMTTKIYYNFVITEEQNPGYIGKIDFTSKVIAVKNHTETSTYLSFDLLQGYIYTVKKVDRDILRRKSFNFIVLYDSSPPTEVNIETIDINDNSPRFTKNIQYINISESANIGDNFYIDSAKDSDNGTNSYISSYTIDRGNGNQVFNLSYNPRTKNVRLVLLRALDRESQSNFYLRVTAYDSGKPVRSGHCFLNVTITDANDNKPVFFETDIRISLFENATVDRRIYYFNATDLDEGRNSKIFYSIKPSRFFSIDQNGWLILGRPIDFETYQKFDLVVTATDGGIPALSSQANVKIDILDVNDNQPRIHLTNGYNFTVLEGYIGSQSLSLVRVYDADSIAANGHVTLNLPNHNDTFQLSPRGQPDRDFLFTLSITKPLDRETIENYDLRLVATDRTFVVTTHAVITVADRNDNFPIFTRASYVSVVPSTAPIGSFITVVHANDADKGLNSDVVYKIIESRFSSFFKIYRRNGVVTTNTTLRSIPSDGIVILNVSATDAGTPPLMSFTTVNITITQQSKECTPIFTNYRRNVTVDKNTKIGEKISEFAASCGGKRDKISYHIQSGYKKYFHMDSKGNLFLRKLKANSTVQLKVIARNIIKPTLYSFVHVNVNFLSPVISVPAYDNRIQIISFKKVSSEPVGRVTYNLLDNKGLASYRIISGNINNSINVNSSTGDIYVPKSLQPSDCAHVIISAQVPGGLNFSTSVFLSENPYQSRKVSFERYAYNFNVVENLPVGSIVGHVATKLSSKDQSKARVSYFIETGNQLLTISNDGYIFTAAEIDREEAQNIELIVVATYGCVFAKASVVIDITDVNDNIPTFVSNEIVTVTNTMNVVYKTRVEDPDVGLNGLLTYQLVADRGQDFCIDNKTGLVGLVKPLVHSVVYQIEIAVRDHGTPSLFSYMIVFILLNNTRNVCSALFSRDYSRDLVVNVNQKLYVPFYTIFNDEDTPSNLNFRSTPNHDIFDVYPNGLLYLKRDLNLEPSSHFEVLITVDNLENPSCRFNITIFLYVDRDVSAGIFLNSVYIFNVTENIAINTSIGHIPVQSFVSNTTLRSDPLNIYLTLDATEIRTVRWIDREEIHKRFGENKLVMRVDGIVDGGYSSCIVVVNILDENDRPPVFLETYTTVAIDENISKLQNLFVAATDEDNPPYDQVRYKILSGNNGDVFALNSRSGELSLNKILDWEYNRKYRLKILASDSLLEEFSDTMEIVLHVKNVNDNAPVFQSITNVILDISENTTVGSVLRKMRATDRDINGLLAYEIVSGNDHKYFALHPNNGNLQLTRPLDYETEKQYMLKIVASDGRFSGFTFVTINVLNANDNSPTFNNSSIRLYVDENIDINQQLNRCVATDLDGDVVKYSLKIRPSWSKYFNLDHKNCELYIVSKLNGFKLSKFKFAIVADDGVHASYLEVNIFVRSTNPPMMISLTSIIVDPQIKPDTTQGIYKARVENIRDGEFAFHLLGWFNFCCTIRNFYRESVE